MLHTRRANQLTQQQQHKQQTAMFVCGCVCTCADAASAARGEKIVKLTARLRKTQRCYQGTGSVLLILSSQTLRLPAGTRCNSKCVSERSAPAVNSLYCRARRAPGHFTGVAMHKQLIFFEFWPYVLCTISASST